MEYIGYLASIIILISLLMSSVKKLRWINLFGSLTFVIYGILIKAYPVAILNIGTVGINIYYLIKMANKQTFFKILEIEQNSKYFEYFLQYYQFDIEKYLDVLTVDIDNADISFYILRDLIPAGVFVGSRYNQDTLKIEIDYVSPAYRDFLIGKYVYSQQKQLFLSKGFSNLITFTNNQNHKSYLEKMGFIKSESLKQDNLDCYKISL